MKVCSASILYVLQILRIASAAYLRHAVDAVSGAPDAASDYGAAPEYKLTLTNYKGVQYFAPITFNKQKMSAVYDTGSFEIMAMSQMCTICKIPEGLVKYDNTSSSTFEKGAAAGIEDHNFAGGLVQARQDFETVHIGDAGKDVTVEHMPFWQVVNTEMRVWMSRKAQFTAIVGLGHRTAVPGTFVDSLLERTGSHRFAICLQKGPSQPGFITFNPKLDAASIELATVKGVPVSTHSMYRRVPVIGKHHWAVDLNEVSYFDGKVTDSLCGDNWGNHCKAIIDSGTSLLGVPSSGVPLIQKLSNAVKKDCSNFHELRDLTFTLGGHKFVLPASAYVVKWPGKNGEAPQCLPGFTDFKMEDAYSSDVWVLGMPFLRQFYTVFDRVEPSIYIAQQGLNCEPAASNSTGAHGFHQKLHGEPTIVDMDETMSPSWLSERFAEI
jgi:hypothetical protein